MQPRPKYQGNCSATQATGCGLEEVVVSATPLPPFGQPGQRPAPGTSYFPGAFPVPLPQKPRAPGFAPSPQPSRVPVRQLPTPPGPLPPGPLEPTLEPGLELPPGGGEPPSITITATPEYPEPRPRVGERIFFPLPAPTWLAKIFRFVTGPWSPLGDLGNLLLYSQTLGPDQAVEAANVIKQLVPAAVPLAPVPLPDVEGLPYPDFEVSGGATLLPEIIVSGVRTAGTTYPLANPLLQSFGLPQLGFTPLSSPHTQLAPATATALAPLTGLNLQPLALTDLTNAIRIGTASGPGIRPRTGFTPSPLENALAQPLPDLSNTQCQCTSTQKKKGKQRKPRNVCYRGVYEDRKNGLVKLKRERIACR